MIYSRITADILLRIFKKKNRPAKHRSANSFFESEAEILVKEFVNCCPDGIPNGSDHCEYNAEIVEIKEREHLDKIDDIKGEQREIAWGSQIRSYVFMPYTLAKDHRTGFEAGNINAVMDGDIDGFINAYLKMESLKDSSK